MTKVKSVNKKKKSPKTSQQLTNYVPLQELHNRLLLELFKDLPQEINFFYSNPSQEQMEVFVFQHQDRFNNLSNAFHNLLWHNFFEVYQSNHLKSPLTQEDFSQLFRENLLLKNTLIPKEQFDYFVTTGRRWCDKVTKRKDGTIISEWSFGIATLQMEGKSLRKIVVEDIRQVKVDDENNLVGYVELRDKLKEDGIEDFEINLLIKYSFKYGNYNLDDERPIILKNNLISKDGYVSVFIENEESFGLKNPYLTTFYIKSQINSFEPKYKFYKYDQVIERWQNCGIDEEDAKEFMKAYSSFRPFPDKDNILHIMTTTGVPLYKEELSKNFDILKEVFFEKEWLEEVERRHRLKSKQENITEDIITKIHKSNEDFALESKKDDKKNSKERGGKVLTRLIDTIIKNYGNKGKKEDNWNSIISVIKQSNPNNQSGQIIVKFGEAKNFVFGHLTLDTNQLIIYWKGAYKKSQPTKIQTYSREQFFDKHKKILERNGKNF